jgi:trimeric autotransporter adhesin
VTTFPPRHACRRSAGPFLCLAAWLAPGTAWAVSPKEPDPSTFFKPELYISTSSVELSEALPQLANRAAWEAFYGRRGEDPSGPRTPAWIDPRSGAAVNILLSDPLIPGPGLGNRLTLEDFAVRSGAREVTPAAVGALVRQYVTSQGDVLGIDVRQLGTPVAHEATPGLWHVSIPQRFEGVPVRYGRVLATIAKGNLVLLGTETWGDVRGLTTRAGITGGQALQAGYNHLQALAVDLEIVRQPRLEIIPIAPPELQQGEGYGGPIGEGYRHRLAWTYVLKQPGEIAEYEAIVDADTGELLSFQDVVEYVERQVTGGVYPLANGTCGNPALCGSLQPLTPMPFTDTGLASPNNFTNSAGIFNWTSGPVRTTLTGRFVDVVDRCGTISESAPTGGNLNLGGVNGQHDCQASGASDGNTPASRTAYYELNRIQEMARGWLPNNTWLGSRLIANVNLTQTCTAFYNGSVNFVRSGAGCGNTGELAGVMHHEWGHGMDRNDSGGNSSNSGEAYADMAALVRTQDSCVADGLWVTRDQGCGRASNGQMNTNMADRGLHCAVDCSGKRETDWTKHVGGQPDTPLGFVCGSCNPGGGPCGREVHCAAAPSTQSLWDLAVRDLRAAPFNMDSQTAWLTASRLYFVGSGNVGAWHSCTCGGTASGCAAANGYMQWLAADDDNGSLADGTPHMTAIFSAFSRHGIACNTPAPRNSGCANGPTAAPDLTATPGSFRNALSWSAVPGAQRYWVFKTEGPAGCDYGKARVATLNASTTTFTDTQVANGRRYSYNVMAVGSSDACFSPASACVQATPTEGVPAPDFQVSVSPSALTVAQGGSGTTTAAVGSLNGFEGAVSLSCGNLPAGVTCTFDPESVTPPANGTAASALTLDVAPEAATGTTTVQVRGNSGALSRTAALSLTVTPVGGPGVVFTDDFTTDRGWTRNPSGTDRATTGLWQRGVPQTTSSGGTALQIAAQSPTFDLVTGASAGNGVGANDVDGGVTSILSPQITLPAGGTLTLSFASYLAHLSNATGADFLRVTVVGNTSVVVLSRPGVSVNRAGAWTTTTADISAFAGQTVRILVEAADNGSGSLIEAGIDDVTITGQ